MATIYPFSIYTSKGQVYPSVGENLTVDLSWLGWKPELIKKQIDSVNQILENRTLNIPNNGNEGVLYMLPDLSMVDLSEWNTNPLDLHDQKYMVFKDNELVVDFSEIDYIRETSFQNLRNLESIEFIGNAKVIQSWGDQQLDCARLTNLFSDCQNLTSVTGLDLTDYTHIYPENMFINCNKLSELDIAIGKPYGSVSSMFSGCHELEEIPITTMDMSDVTNANSLFSDCRKCHAFPTLTNMDNLTNISQMFYNCSGGGQGWWDWNPDEYPYQGTLDIEISFAPNVNANEFLTNSYIIHSVTINTTNMPNENRFLNMNSDTGWLSQLKIYVPASVVTDWVTLIKSSTDDPEKQAIVDNMVEAIQN